VTQDFSPVAGTLAPGDQIAGYQIAEAIGTGGMAVVYRALDLRLDRPVALKVLTPRLAEDDAFRQRFIRESRAAAGVDHPHIVPVFEAGEADGVLFIAMRYVSGGDVRKLIQSEGRLSPGRAAAIGAQAASALDAAHAHGLVHRDVKPGNILLDSAGGRDHVYLADFGLSKHSLASTTLTAAGQFMGTLDYVSPEQIQGQPADGRADQYALACTIVEMLSGRPPYKRDESMALLWAQLEAPPPLLTELRPDLPAEVNLVMRTALAKLPADRYPTCAAFTSALATAFDARPMLREPTRLAALPTEIAALSATPIPSVPEGPGLTRPEPIPVMNGRGPQAPAPPAPGRREPVPRAPASQQPPPRQPEPRRPEPRRPEPRAAVVGERGERLPQPGQPRRVVNGLADPQQRRQPPAGQPAQREPHLVPQRQPARGNPANRHRAGRVVGALVAVAVIAGGGVAAYVISHRTHAGHPGTVYKTVTEPPPAAALLPAQTVQAYFTALNAKNYPRAWQLDSVVHQNQNYQQFVKGYSGTKDNTVTIIGTNGNVVSAQLVATQVNGTVKTFSGTYTVTNGVITGAHMLQVSG
jgi:serine/threonine protein kinase